MSGYADLVLNDRVHSDIFTNAEIFEAEMERIFHRWWIYVGHVSEVPEPGDYALKSIGRQSVIMTRDADGQVRLLLNRCRHRGNAVCNQISGNSSFFRCQYHGWTYSNRGDLVGLPIPSSYQKPLDKKALGLTPVPSFGEYRGFVFGCLAESPPGPLLDYLGKAAEFINNFVNASPQGEVELKAGRSRGFYRGNWKFVGMDGYHPAFTHRSINDLVSRKAALTGKEAFLHSVYSDRSPNRTVDLGNGHVRLDLYPAKEAVLDSLVEDRAGSPSGEKYLALMEEAYGERVNDVLLYSGDPHLGLWPNLQLIGPQVRVVQPVAAEMTEVITYPALLKGVPDEINESRIRQQEYFGGPAGFGTSDDYEMFERNQVGLSARVNPWLLLSRGLHTETTDDDGFLVANVTDEVTQRGQLRQWLAAMDHGALAAAPA
ncbi:MAG: aromatic ring-hydroxylating oxygenase subunit alpha [Micromonosporaceae bacterium]